MRIIKSLFIIALTFTFTLSYEVKYDYDWDMSACGEEEEMPADKFASLYLYFVTKMDNGLPSHQIGPIINVPCDKGHDFTLQFEINGVGGTIVDLDNDNQPQLYNGASSMSTVMDLEAAQEHIENEIMTLKEPIVGAKVELKLKSATIKLDVANKFIVERLEEHGISYSRSVNSYEVSQDLKEQMKQKLAAKTATNTQYIELPANISQDMIRQIMQGKTTFNETKGNQKVTVNVTRKLYKQLPDGTMQEIIM
jgi:hypothetical protein